MQRIVTVLCLILGFLLLAVLVAIPAPRRPRLPKATTSTSLLLILSTANRWAHTTTIARSWHLIRRLFA